MAWDSDEVLWIRLMDKLMTMMLGGDFLNYDFDRKKICHVTVECKPAFIYKREDWLEEYVRMVNSDDMNMCIEEGLFLIMLCSNEQTNFVIFNKLHVLSKDASMAAGSIQTKTNL